MAERKVKAWITINGVHVPLYEGESKDDAVKRSIKQAQENRKKDDDQKDKDIARNQSEKDKLNKANSLIDEQNKIIEKHGPDSKEYRDFNKKKEEFTGKKDDQKEVSKGVVKENLDTIKRKKEAMARAEAAGDKKAAAALKEDIESLRKQNSAAHDNFRNASSGKASDAARVKKTSKSKELIYGDNKEPRIDNLSKFLKDNKDRDTIVVRSTYAKGGWDDVQFDARVNGYNVYRNSNDSRMKNGSFKETYEFVRIVPSSFASKYPNLSQTQLKAKYEEFLKKNRK